MLCSFLEKNKRYIVDKWIYLLKTQISERYKKRPIEELQKTVSWAFEGNFEVLCNNNWSSIEEFIIFITKIRLEKGFTLSEVQRAFGLFRIIMIDLLVENFTGEKLKHALEKVNFCVDVTINRFSEYFQKKHDEIKENLLKILEDKVKERTKELEESRKRYKTLVEDINDGYFVSRKGKIVYVNRALCKMFNYAYDDVINKSISQFVKNYDEIQKKFKKGDSFEAIGVKKDGTEFPIEIKANKIEYENMPAIAGICRDITERIKSMENERLAMIGRLASAFAHEIRNSISSIKVNMQILKNKYSFQSVDKKRIELIFKDIEKLDKIIRDTQFFSKPIELNYEDTNLNNIIMDVSKKLKPILSREKIKLKVELDKKLKNISIDREKFEFVLENLFYNSIDALFKRKNKLIWIKTLQNNNFQKIIFYDNGIGIDRVNLTDIFKPFYTTKSKGMGLGLANVERIVSLHKGKIDVKSLKDKFTQIEIELPC